jgi:DNA-binding NarL/FixJ family response regulator
VKTRILLADDKKATRHIIATLINSQPGMEVVAEAGNGVEAFKMAREHQPDVIIMDINMPVLNGIHASRLIIDDFPEIKILGLSIYSDCQFVEGMLNAGAAGYVLKDLLFEQLIPAIRKVTENQTYISPEIQCSVAEECSSPI